MAFHPHPLLFPAIGFVAGSVVPLEGVSLPLLAALAVGGLLAMAAILRPRAVPVAALMAASAAAGACLAADARHSFRRDAGRPVLVNVEGPVILEGQVVSEPRVVDDEMRFEVLASRVTVAGMVHGYGGRVRVFVRGARAESATPRKGDRIRAWVDLRLPEPRRTPGGFDQLEWARREGIHAFATCKSERLLQVTSPRERAPSFIDAARDLLKHSWRHVPGPLDRAVTTSMVLGDEGALDRRTRDEFRSAGLLHLLVVSGSQVAALILALRRALPRSLRITWAGCVVEGAVLLSYCLIAGAGDSIVRATLMALAFAVAARVDLERGSVNFLFAAALILLTLRPLDALDPGAQLSFAATLALVTFAPRLSRALESRGVPGFLADILSATLVASVAVIPVTLLHFHRFTAIAIPANLLAAPLAVLLLYGSLLTAALDPLLPSLASLAGAGCGLIAESLRTLAHHAALSDPDWRGPSPPLVLILGFLGLCTAPGWRRCALPAAGLLATLTMSGLPAGDGRLHLWFLDVGQGDAILIETPSGSAAMIDAGPAYPGFDAGERVVGETLWALGHHRLDSLAITHRHADHGGGASFLASHWAPRRLYVNDDSPALKPLGPRTMRRGDAWVLDGVRFDVLGPDPGWGLSGRDENARSLIIEVTFGATSFLLMGDASKDSEARLDLPRSRYDLVKTGHHGAATSSSADFIQRTRPRVAVISVGARNRFSHPSRDVVDRWTKAGALVWRTDLRGTLHVVSDGRELRW
jgi:competence protein ComEC